LGIRNSTDPKDLIIGFHSAHRRRLFKVPVEKKQVSQGCVVAFTIFTKVEWNCRKGGPVGDASGNLQAAGGISGRRHTTLYGNSAIQA
jgi:hypothetical protein